MAKLDKEYDVIVVGGGINGLACAAYLQKSGLKVAVFERRVECGTHCCTEELMHPGVKVNLCANLIHVMSSPAYDELELERFGLEMRISTEWTFFYPFKKDKSAVLLHAWDARKTYQAWQRINEKDAEVYRKLVNHIAPRIVDWEEQLVYSVLTEEMVSKIVDDMKGCSALPSDFAKMSPAEFAEEIYEDDRIKANTLAVNLLFATDPLSPATVPNTLLMGPTTTHIAYQSGVPRGGAHAIAHALSRCFLHYGGSIFTNCPVAKIIVENGEAKGVALSKEAVYPEAEVRATRAVVSDLTCQPTFIDLVGLDKLPAYAEAIKAYSYDAIILFTNYWVLSEPPDWEGAGYPSEVARAYGFNYGLDNGVSDARRLHEDFEARRPSDPPIVCGLSVQNFCFADPTQAPPGQYTLMSWSNVPYDLRELGGAQAWDDIREKYGDKVEDLLAEYVPNIKKAKIGRYCESPFGYYRRNRAAIKGHWGAPRIPSQSGLNAPFPGCGAPRTPIAKLYISNYQTGSTWLENGRKGADIVARDLGVKEKQDWWKVRPFEPLLKVLRRKGIQPRWTVD